MKATEIRDKLDELVNEFGDAEGKMPDPLEGKWLNGITDVRWDPDHEVIVIASED